MRFILLSTVVILQGLKSSEGNSAEEAFGFDQHKELLRKSQTLLQSGQCKHVYLDIGTNIGVQIKKL